MACHCGVAGIMYIFERKEVGWCWVLGESSEERGKAGENGTRNDEEGEGGPAHFVLRVCSYACGNDAGEDDGTEREKIHVTLCDKGPTKAKQRRKIHIQSGSRGLADTIGFCSFHAKTNPMPHSSPVADRPPSPPSPTSNPTKMRQHHDNHRSNMRATNPA